jgi:hypothetical protein
VLGFQPDNTRRYKAIVLSLFGLLVALNLTDLLSTSIALGIGLSEGNGAILSIADYLGTSIVVAVGLSKAVFISAAGLVSFLGIRTASTTVRTRVVILLVVLTAMLGVVSVNNFYLIGATS